MNDQSEVEMDDVVLPVPIASNDENEFIMSFTSSTDFPFPSTTTEAANTTTTTDATTTTSTGPTTTKWFNPGTPETPSPEAQLEPAEVVDWDAFADTLKEKLDDESTGLKEVSDSAVNLEEVDNTENKSYFSCSPSVTAADGLITPPGTAIVLSYDYDVVTKTVDMDANTLSSLDDEIAKNLAGIYGLTTCKRRNLRGLSNVPILALDSKPADISVADSTKCAAEVASDLTCTPIRGFMTAYVLDELSSDSALEETKTNLLADINNSMTAGAYTDNNIVSTNFVGEREDITNPFEVSSDVLIELVPVDNKDLSINEAMAAGPEEEAWDNRPSLAIGLFIFFACLAVLVGVTVFIVHVRKRSTNKTSPESSEQPMEGSDKQIIPETEKKASEESTVDLTEKGTLDSTSDDNYGNPVASNTLSSSGDEDDIKYGMTEDYSDYNITQNNQLHATTLPTIASDPDLGARSFETGTPRSSPRNVPVPESSLLGGILSPATSVEEDLLGDIDGTTLDTIPI